MKANNLIRFINEQLGSPVNRFSVMGRYSLQGVQENEPGRSHGLLNSARGYYEVLRLRLFLLLHPLIQWALVDVYLRFASPKVWKVMAQKKAQGVDLSF